MSTLTLLFNIVMEVLPQIKLLKGIQTGKERVKWSLFTNNIILYLENPKECMIKLVELLNKFNKVKRLKKIYW